MAPGGQGTLVNICNSTVRILPQDPALLHSHKLGHGAALRGQAGLGGQQHRTSQEQASGTGADGGQETIITEGETEAQGGGGLF